MKIYIRIFPKCTMYDMLVILTLSGIPFSIFYFMVFILIICSFILLEEGEVFKSFGRPLSWERESKKMQLFMSQKPLAHSNQVTRAVCCIVCSMCRRGKKVDRYCIFKPFKQVMRNRSLQKTLMEFSFAILNFGSRCFIFVTPSFCVQSFMLIVIETFYSRFLFYV